MIRIGSSPSGVQHKLNTFHSTSSVTAGFFANATGGPPPVSDSLFASAYTEAPWARQGGTFFVDPYGFTTVPTSVSKFYMSFQLAELDINLSWANAYDGTANAIIPDGPLKTLVPLDPGAQTYVRLRNSSRAFRIFFYRNATSKRDYVLLVGPENATKLSSPFDGSLTIFYGVKAARMFVELQGSLTDFLLIKDEGVIDTDYVPEESFVEKGLSGSLANVFNIHIAFIR